MLSRFTKTLPDGLNRQHVVHVREGRQGSRAHAPTHHAALTNPPAPLLHPLLATPPLHVQHTQHMQSDDRLFLGLDSSTQGLKATAVDAANNVVYSAAINYDESLPDFKTENGMHTEGA